MYVTQLEYTNSIHKIYMGGNGTSAYNMHNTVCTVNTFVCMYVYAAASSINITSCVYIYIPHCWPIGLGLALGLLFHHLGVCFQYMKDLFLIMHHPCIKLNSYCIKQCVSCQDFCFPFLRCLHCHHCLLGGTVGCHHDCIRSCYSCVILADLQAETEGYANCLAI